MADVVSLDRHVLASPATAFDTAWSTYGWTAGIRDRVGRLEEEVPWGTHVAQAADPPRLSGPAETLLRPENLERLGSAVLRVDGRLGFALWGAFGSSDESDRRVLTHTLLMDDEAFRQLAGYPQGLLWSGDRPAAWFRDLVERRDFLEPTPLEPVRMTLDRALTAELAQARIVELARLRRAVLEQHGGNADRLASQLASIYEAVARATAGDEIRHVVVRGVGAATSRLLRFVWLSLPLDDRIKVSYVTEQRRSERPRGLLLGLPDAEWGRYVPDGSWVVGEHEPAEAGAGRVHWARTLATSDSLEAFRQLDARAAVRRWRLVTADDLTAEGARGAWQVAWASTGPTLDQVRELLELEEERPGGMRARAVGHALGQALATADAAPGDDDALEAAARLTAELPSPARVGVLRGAVRALRGRGAEGRRRAALLRCRAAASGDAALSAELHRLVDRESDALRALVADRESGGGLELVLGALPLAAAGDPVGRELVRLGTAETRWTAARAAALGTTLSGWSVDGDPAQILADILTTLVREGDDEGWQGLVSQAPATWLARPPILKQLVDALEAGRHPFGTDAGATAGELAHPLASRLLARASPTGLGPERAIAVLRLLWAAGSDQALDALDPRSDTRVAVLAELLAAPAPIPLFHRIRRRLEEALDAEGAGRSAEPWVDALRPYAPALSQRLAGNGTVAAHAPRIFVGAGP